MKYFFTLLFAIILNGAKAQTYPWLNQFYNEIPTKESLWDSSVAANHYRSMTRTLTQFNKKGTLKKRTDISILKYDDKGFLISLEESNSINKKNERYEYIFRDSMIIGYTVYKNNKLVRTYNITRNAAKRITDVIKKDGKGNIVQKQHHDFDPATNLVSKATMYGKSGKEKSAIEYTYFDGKNMKQAKEYRKGKLKRVWNYTCDPKGTDEKKVKEIKVCKNVNVDENGNRVETNRIVNSKGEVELRVNTFDKKERMIKQKIYDDNKHKLRSEFATSPTQNGNEETIYTYYNKKEKPIWISKAVYNGSHKIISSEFSVGKNLKRVYKNTYQYNNKNLITHSESFDNKGRKTLENIHTYN